MRNGATLLGSFPSRDGRIGAGGWVTGITFAADGTKMIRTDTYNGYTAPQGTNVTWTECLKPGINVAESDINLFYGSAGYEPSPWTSPGTFDTAIAPSNSVVRYAVCLGRVYVTQNSGTAWTLCTIGPKLGLEPNAANRMTGKALAVDPQNPAVCFFGAPDGLFVTTDYGVTWTAISTASVPVPATDKRYIVAFDPSSSVSGGRKQGVYVFVNGSGLYKSTNAGSTWAKVTDRPTNPTSAGHLKIAANGNVYLTGTGNSEDAAQFSRWNGAAWFEPTGVVAKSLAISPFNAGYIYICGGGGGLGLSKDYGSTFELGGFCLPNSRLSPAIPWQQVTVENYMSNGDMEFDPTTNTLYVAEGIGVWYCVNPPTDISYGPSVTWTSCSVGIENMVCFPGSFAPNGTLIQSIGDRAGMTFPKATLGVQFPTCHPTGGGAIQNSCGGDYAPEDPNFVVYATSFCGSAAFTTDAGGSYTIRDTLSGVSGANGIGGNIAVFTKDKWVLVETNAGKVWRTSDRGLTWTRCIIGTDTDQFWHGYIYHCRRVLVKDRYVLGRAYIYNHGAGEVVSPASVDRGVWRTDDYGATWTKTYNGYIIGFGADYYHGKLTQYDATSLLWCGGDNALGLWKLSGVDGTATKSEVTGSDDVLGAARWGEVYGVGVAKGASSSTSPAVLVCGFRMVTPANASSINDPSGFGYWLSLDGMVTWTRIAKFIGGNFDLCQDVAGDPSTFARFAIGHGGSGNQIVDYSNVQRWN